MPNVSAGTYRDVMVEQVDGNTLSARVARSFARSWGTFALSGVRAEVREAMGEADALTFWRLLSDYLKGGLDDAARAEFVARVRAAEASK